MSFHSAFYTVKGYVVERLKDYGIRNASMQAGWTSMLNTSQNTYVTIEAPLNLIYSDNFIINGVLFTDSNRPLANKVVELKVDNEIVETCTTSNEGEYIFSQTPVTKGNHSFQVIFRGTDVYVSSESTVLNREVGKETSILKVNPMTIQHEDSDALFEGTLLTDDDEPIPNATIEFYKNEELIGTTTTNSNGEYSYTMEAK